MNPIGLFERISTKLSLIFVVTLCLFFYIFYSTVRNILPEHPRNQLSERLVQTVLGDVPNTDDLSDYRHLAERLDVDIQVIDTVGVWASANVFPPLEDIERQSSIYQTRQSFEFSQGGERYFVFRQDTRTFVITGFVEGLSRDGQIILIFSAIATILTVGSAFFAVNRIISPIHPMTDVVDAIGKGNLDARVEIARDDELGRLAGHINVMAEALSTMKQSNQDLLVAIGHEFSSPIARILFQIEQIEDEDLKQKVMRNLMRINLLLRTLLTVETLAMGRDGVEVHPTSYPTFLKEFVEDLNEPQVSIRTYGPSEILYLDTLRIEILLNNLITNAVRYGEGTKVEVIGELTTDGLHLTVMDRGPGWAPDFIDKVFEPFSRQDRSRGFDVEGAGLGLYLCHNLVRAKGGTIKVSNRVRGGAQVDVFLPRAERPEP